MNGSIQVLYNAQLAPELRAIITKPHKPGSKIILSRTGKLEYLVYKPTGRYLPVQGGYEYSLRGRRAI